MAEIKLSDLPWGGLNNIQDNADGLSGDRRRTSTTTALRLSAEAAYGINTLNNINEFNGVIVSYRPVAYPSYKNRTAMFENYVYSENSEEEGEQKPIDYPTFAYKIYIPELECRPVPQSFNDPVLITYPDVYSDIEGTNNLPLELGLLVAVKYEDVDNLFNPRIIRKVGGPIQIQNIASENLNKAFSEAQISVAGAYAGDRVNSGACVKDGRIPEQCPEAVDNKEQTIPSVALSGRLDFTQLKDFYDGPFKATGFFDWIGKGEGDPNSVNRGVGGDSPGGSSKYIEQGEHKGSNLIDLTFGQVYSLMQAGSYRGSAAGDVKRLEDNAINRKKTTHHPSGRVGVQRGFLAVGKMQFIPGTLSAAMKATKVDQSETYFTAENQQVLGVYLCLGGQGGSLGSYLLGYHDNVGKAGQNLARIWASVPLQFPENGCQPGYSRYCGGGENSSCPLRKTPCEVIDRLKQLRNSIAQFQGLKDSLINSLPPGSFEYPS